jgi:hypothetical protein
LGGKSAKPEVRSQKPEAKLQAAGRKLGVGAKLEVGGQKSEAQSQLRKRTINNDNHDNK